MTITLPPRPEPPARPTPVPARLAVRGPSGEWIGACTAHTGAATEYVLAPHDVPDGHRARAVSLRLADHGETCHTCGEQDGAAYRAAWRKWRTGPEHRAWVRECDRIMREAGEW